MTARDGSVYELQHTKIQSKFPQYRKWVTRTNETRQGYNLWIVSFYEGTDRNRRVWLDANAKSYNFPQFGDSTVLSDPPKDVTITDGGAK